MRGFTVLLHRKKYISELGFFLRVACVRGGCTQPKSQSSITKKSEY